MSLRPSDKAARDALLDELQAALTEWSTEETTRITEETAFLNSVLIGRGGAAKLASANVDRGTILAADSISFFLRGS